MSYILEALKKAQAERQLGNAPDIHAPQAAQVAPAAADGLGPGRKPLLAGLGIGVLVIGAGAALLWRHAPAPAPASSPGAQTVQVAAVPSASPFAPIVDQAAAPVRQAAPSSAGAAAASPTLAVRAPDAPSAPPAGAAFAPAATRALQARPVAGSVAGSPVASTASAGAGVRIAAAQPPAGSSAPAAATAPASRASASAPEDSPPLLQQLPESVQAQVPRVSFGGYMYSANPADRLVLVDKGLRHEGEEVAPGLVLEKLLPHAAVMNFRGVRYRVAY